MKNHLKCLPALFVLLLIAYPAQAHFGMVIPSDNTATQQSREVELTLSFSHPFEGVGMDLVKPQKFYVVHEGKNTSLLDQLKPATVMGHKGWSMVHRPDRPGVYQYVMEPVPYWEPAEDLFIIHYTKTIVAAFGDEAGWDQPTGLPTEIVPMLRPFGNYSGNTFSGQVLLDSLPAAGAEVEVEYLGNGELAPPGDYHITQVVKADEKGIFTFGCPLPGWWGFSALSEADYTMTGPENTDKGVELGAVLWVYFDPLPARKQQ